MRCSVFNQRRGPLLQQVICDGLSQYERFRETSGLSRVKPTAAITTENDRFETYRFALRHHRDADRRVAPGA